MGGDNNMNCCQCRFNCTTLAVIASAIIGIVAAFLTMSGNLALGTTFLWVFFGIAIALLAVNLVVSGLYNNENKPDCLCPTQAITLTGILGTVLFSIILLLVDVALTSVIGTILSGLLFASFALTLTSTACLIKCLGECR